jgi:hypothetical protein
LPFPFLFHLLEDFTASDIGHDHDGAGATASVTGLAAF